MTATENDKMKIAEWASVFTTPNNKDVRKTNKKITALTVEQNVST